MSANLNRIFNSIVTRNILTFLVILTLVVVPLVYRFLDDVRALKSETIRVQLDAVAELGRFMLDAGTVDQLRNAIWYGTPEHQQVLAALATIQRNFQMDNAVLMRRAPGGQFVYIADGNRQFEINQPADVHRLFPTTLPPAVRAWQTGQPSETELFRSGDSSWFQVYTPLKMGDRVVALLLLNRFATPVAAAIATRQKEILLGMALALAGGIFVWWFVTSRSLRPLLRLRAASGEIAAGRLEVEIPEYQSRSEVGALYHDFRTMVRDLRASRAEIEEYNRTLEERIRQRTWDLQLLLDNMDEGLLTMGADGKIDPRFSAATVEMVGEQGTQTNFFDLLTADPAERQTARETFGLLLGDAVFLAWEEMVANIPTEFQGEGGRWLKARYRAVSDTEGGKTERVMVILRDVTEEKALRRDMDRNSARQNMVVQIIQNRETFELFYQDALKLLDDARRVIAGMEIVRRGAVDEIFRAMHTIKGTAGVFGFQDCAGLAHGAEDILRELKEKRDEPLPVAVRDDLLERIGGVVESLTAARREFLELVGEDDAEPSHTISESRLESLRREILAAVPEGARERVGGMLARIKNVPAERLLRKYRSLVETTAARLGKQARFRFEGGGDTNLPPAFFQQIDPTFLHLIRNSLDHGIEDVEGRLGAGKEQMATITCVAHRSNGGIEFTIRDDGRGVDLEKIKKIAMERGFVKPGRAGEMTREEVLRLMFTPGFSSKEQVSDISGRGVGLDVVRTDVGRLKGRLRVETWTGRGTAFHLYYPLGT